MTPKPLARGFAGAALATLLMLSLAGCGVSKSQYLSLSQSRDSLASVNQQLQTTLDAANKDKTQLQTDKTALEARVQEMESASQQLGTQLALADSSTQSLKSTYDDLIGKLQSELSSGKIQIEQIRDGVNVNLAQDILFKSGSAELDKVGRELLLKVAEELKGSTFLIFVIGHTDNQKIGASLASRYPTNWELGAARASRIVRLFEESGLPKDRLSAVSSSDSRPRESNETAEGRAKNRRIEIRLRPAPVDQPVTNQ